MCPAKPFSINYNFNKEVVDLNTIRQTTESFRKFIDTPVNESGNTYCIRNLLDKVNDENKRLLMTTLLIKEMHQNIPTEEHKHDIYRFIVSTSEDTDYLYETLFSVNIMVNRALECNLSTDVISSIKEILATFETDMDISEETTIGEIFGFLNTSYIEAENLDTQNKHKVMKAADSIVASLTLHPYNICFNHINHNNQTTQEVI